MTNLTDEDILKLARLARLRLSEDELPRFRREITAILEYVKILGSVDTDGLQPTYQVTGLQNVMRADEIVDYGSSPEQLLKNVPATEKGHIKTRRMIG